MTGNQRSVLSWLGVAMLIVVAVLMFAMYRQLEGGKFLDVTNIDDPKLSRLWAVFAWLVRLGKTASITFAALLAVISAAVAISAKTFEKKWQLVLVVVVCFFGIGSTVFWMAELDNEEIIRALRIYGHFSPKVDDAAARSAFNWLGGGVITWLGSYLALALGVKVANHISAAK